MGVGETSDNLDRGATRATDVLLALCAFGVALVVRTVTWPAVLTAEGIRLVGPDAHYHLRRIVWTVENFPKVLTRDFYVSFPNGGEPIWTPFFEQAIAWVTSNQKSGLIIRDTSHGELYSHGISTLMLGEVIGMVDSKRKGLEIVHRVHRTAVNVILRAQNVPKDRWNLGGWRYTPSSEVSDISVSGWQLLALRAAKDTGLPVPDKNIRQAVHYIKRCAHPTGGFSYQPGGDPNTGRTGTGILSLEICGEHGSPEARRGGDWLLKNPLKWKGPFFYYGSYYATQGMYQLGGNYWKQWQTVSEKLLLEKQSEDGSWPSPPRATHEEQAGSIYTTAMAILSLGVEFRYLPIYQR